MENKKPKDSWKNFDTAFGELLSARPGDYFDASRSHPDIYMFDKIYNAFHSLYEWILDIETSLEDISDDMLVVGWNAIGDIVGESPRNLMRKKKKLLQDGVIWEAEIGDPIRKRIVSKPSRLVRYILAKKRKTRFFYSCHRVTSPLYRFSVCDYNMLNGNWSGLPTQIVTPCVSTPRY